MLTFINWMILEPFITLDIFNTTNNILIHNEK